MIELHIFTQKEEWHNVGGYDTYQVTWEGTVHEIERTTGTWHHESTYKIATTQVGILYTKLLDKDMRVFIHDDNGCHEITLGMKLKEGVRIHRSNNLFAFWYNGMFRK